MIGPLEKGLLLLVDYAKWPSAVVGWYEEFLEECEEEEEEVA